MKDLFTELGDHLGFIEQSVGQMVEVADWPGTAENGECKKTPLL